MNKKKQYFVNVIKECPLKRLTEVTVGGMTNSFWWQLHNGIESFQREHSYPNVFQYLTRCLLDFLAITIWIFHHLRKQEFSIKSYIIPMWIERESYYIFLEEIFTACNDKMNTPVYKMMNWPFSCQTSVKCMIVSEELK